MYITNLLVVVVFWLHPHSHLLHLSHSLLCFFHLYSFQDCGHQNFRMHFLSSVAVAVTFVASTSYAAPSTAPIAKRCTNSATDRSCWSDNFDLSTNYYEEVPDTGVTREVSSHQSWTSKQPILTALSTTSSLSTPRHHSMV